MKPARLGYPSPLSAFSTFSDEGHSRSGKKKEKWLFNRSVLEAFYGAWRVTGDGRNPAQRLVQLGLLGASTDVCNATKDGKGLRYRKDWRDRDFSSADFIAAFEKRVVQIAEDLESAVLEHNRTRIGVGDVRFRSVGGGFRLCVTSPPYLNSFDYTDIYRPELFLGGWVRTMEELRELRLRTLRSHVQVQWPTPVDNDFGDSYARVIAQLRSLKEQLWDVRIPFMVQAYFEDMSLVLKRLRKVAAQNASVWIVVSTSAYGGFEIPVDLILADIGSRCGWYLREVSVLRYLGRVSSQQWSELAEVSERDQPHLRESVVIFDRRPRG